MPMDALGVIAGNGVFPGLVAKGAREKGLRVVVAAHRGESLSEVAEHAHAIEWFRVGQIGHILSFLKKQSVRTACFAGGVNKGRWMARLRPDWAGCQLLAHVATRRDDGLLRATASWFEGRGISIVDGTEWVTGAYWPKGQIAGPPLSAEQEKDGRLGWMIAKNLGQLDVGQTVVVRAGVPIALEGIEGTDATILRGGSLTQRGSVVVKVSKPSQDLRFDQPAVGVGTVEAMVRSGCTALVIEAGKGLVLDAPAVIARASSHGISIVAWSDLEL